MIKRKMQGSVILVLEGKRSGFDAILQFFGGGYLPDVAGFKVEAVKLRTPSADEDDIDYIAELMTQVVRSRSIRKPNPAFNAAFMKPVTPSAALSEIVGSKPIPRTEITKKLWAYIKKNGLQDKKNKRLIKSDVTLKPVFGGKSTVSMFEMTKLVNKHLK